MKYFSAVSIVAFSAAFFTLPPTLAGTSTGAVTEQELYAEECGSCHMVYPPALLPEQSWVKLMGGLEKHFGDNAELDSEIQTKIERYLYVRSADKNRYSVLSKLSRSMSRNNIVIRATELPYFKRQHDEISKRSVVNNPKIKSFSNCIACHTGAERGEFDEDDVRIPRLSSGKNTNSESGFFSSFLKMDDDDDD